MNTVAPSANRPMQLLVINDFLPDKTTGEGRRLTQILQALRELGHAVTFIARDGKNQQLLEPILHGLGIRVYSGDFERLPALGKDVTNSSWSLQAILAHKQFDAAILMQDFRCGISIPEHYLHAIRNNSPQTRILVWNEPLYGRSARRRSEITQQLEHREVAEDWSAREKEAFHRADLIIACHAGDEAWLRLNHSTIQTVVIRPSFPC